MTSGRVPCAALLPRASRRMRRFTRLTNAFSKTIDNHKVAQALYFMHDNR